MTLFIGTVINKKDKKGRVSVPSSFRASLAGQSFNGVVAFPSIQEDALECCGVDYMEDIAESIHAIDAFSRQQADLASTIFGSAHQMPFDSEGRIMLSEPLIEHAHIGDQVAFVGQGFYFQIWNPERRAASAADAQRRAREQNLSFKMLPRRPRTPIPGGMQGSGGSGDVG